MKTLSIPFHRLLTAGTIAAISLLALPQNVHAKNPHSNSQSWGTSSKNKKPKHDDHNDRDDHNQQADHRRDGDNDHDRQIHYSSSPRSTFILSLGNGYAGRGYYYGPPNSPYYYQRSDVSFYATREAAPRAYYNHDNYGNYTIIASVQRALANRGYYHGYIDGRFGSGSRNAIIRYQREHRLSVTGTINATLLRSLGIAIG